VISSLDVANVSAIENVILCVDVKFFVPSMNWSVVCVVKCECYLTVMKVEKLGVSGETSFVRLHGKTFNKSRCFCENEVGLLS